jgi:hypothetical protein
VGDLLVHPHSQVAITRAELLTCGLDLPGATAVRNAAWDVVGRGPRVGSFLFAARGAYHATFPAADVAADDAVLAAIAGGTEPQVVRGWMSRLADHIVRISLPAEPQ